MLPNLEFTSDMAWYCVIYTQRWVAGGIMTASLNEGFRHSTNESKAWGDCRAGHDEHEESSKVLEGGRGRKWGEAVRVLLYERG
jgi:hypothetical protein